MRLIFLWVICLLVIVSSAGAQFDMIAMYGDTTHLDCNIPNLHYVVYRAEVFHFSTAGAKGCRFSAPRQTCLVEGEFCCDYPMFPNTSGNTQIGVTVDYDACLSGWIHVLSIIYVDYSALGSPPCCELPVLPDPGAASGEVEIVNCSDEVIYCEGISGIVNKDSSCPCDVPTGIPSRGTSWGSIKALFSVDDNE